MAARCSQEALLDFLRQNGARVKNADLIEHFKSVFPEEPERKAAVREAFKSYVDNIAVVRTESGVKYVCLRKRFRAPPPEPRGGVRSGPGPELGPAEPDDSRQVEAPRPGANQGEPPPPGANQGEPPRPGEDRQVRDDDAGEEEPAPRPAARAALRHTPGSGYGSDGRARVPRAASPAAAVPERRRDDGGRRREPASAVSGVMGNRESSGREKADADPDPNSGAPPAATAPHIPEIAVTEASPLPAEETVFTLPGPAGTGAAAQVDDAGREGARRVDDAGREDAEEEDAEEEDAGAAGPPDEVDGGDEALLDAHSLSASDGAASPKGSRKHFIEVMMNSSPQLRRSLVFRGSVYLPSRSDSDSVSLLSSNPDEDRASVALDPLEHAWMMCASDGEWTSLCQLLATEPSLVLRKDFITGFTCLHWAAKHGKPELMALIINFAKQHNVPLSVDVRSSSGHTPLHIAAMHDHMEVVKLLVGAYNADVEVRDYSGKKACQYLTDRASVDIRDIIGEYDHSKSEDLRHKDGGRWRFSKVLQSNLKPSRLLSSGECEGVDEEARPREKLLRRKSSLSMMKPRLQKLRARTSQLVQSTSFRDTEELDGSRRASFRSRPKTHLFW